MERLIVITGLSGSGKSLAANCLEDLGFFCVDNLPVGLVRPFCKLIQRGGERSPHAALVIDAREGEYLKNLPAILLDLRSKNAPVELLFFECSDDVLKRRFSETRRPHPMSGPRGTLEQGIRDERVALQALREMADRIIDTSRHTPHEMRAFLQNAFDLSTDGATPNVNVVSFGFKYGVPPEADLLFDVRFLPNPFFVNELRALDGRTPQVQAYLDASELTRQFMDRLKSFVSFLIPLYAAEGKSYLTVALGCTGGKHRSVALAEKLREYLVEQENSCSVSHGRSGPSEPEEDGIVLGMLVVTHGRLAEELVLAACTIVERAGGLHALSIGWDLEVEQARARIKEAIREADDGEGVLVLTDMFGGTPTNLALSLHEEGKIEVVTGVNLSMLIKFTSLRETAQLQEAATKIAEQGREAIHVASHLLESPETKHREDES